MARPVVFIDASSRRPLDPLQRRLTLAIAAVAAMAVLIWWAMRPATAEPALVAQPAKAQWAGSASPFAAVPAGATAPVSSATEPAAAAVMTPTPPPAAPPAETLGAPVVHVTPIRSPSGLAGARGGADAQDTEAEN